MRETEMEINPRVTPSKTATNFLAEHIGHTLSVPPVVTDHGCPLVVRFCVTCFEASDRNHMRMHVSHRDPTDPLYVVSDQQPSHSPDLSARREAVVEAARALIAEWDAALPALNSVCLIAQTHGFPYTGKNLGPFVDRLRALARLDPP